MALKLAMQSYFYCYQRTSVARAKRHALDALKTLQKATIDQTEQQRKSVYNLNIPLRQGFAYITVRY